MGAYVLSRLAQAAITILGISVIAFALAHLSGDAAALLTPPDATPRQKADVQESLGLNKPLPVQYGIFARGIATGDFGTSFRFGEPALSVFWSRFPNTVELALAAALVALVGGILIGVLSAVRAGGVADRFAA